MKPAIVFLAAAFVIGAVTAKPRIQPAPAVQTVYYPKVIGKITLSEGYGVVHDSRLTPTDIVIHSVFSPDGLQRGHRVSVAQLDAGVLAFWVTGEEGVPTAEEPEVHFTVYPAP